MRSEDCSATSYIKFSGCLPQVLAHSVHGLLHRLLQVPIDNVITPVLWLLSYCSLGYLVSEMPSDSKIAPCNFGPQCGKKVDRSRSKFCKAQRTGELGKLLECAWTSVISPLLLWEKVLIYYFIIFVSEQIPSQSPALSRKLSFPTGHK